MNFLVIFILTASLKIFAADFYKSLMIINPKIVDSSLATSRIDQPVCDPLNSTCGIGPWSFGGLMQSIVENNSAADLAEKLFNTWLANQTINSFPLPSRPRVRSILNSWCKDMQGNLNLSKSPFRLLAIVNRPDLRIDGTFGELRFIYGLLHTDDNCDNDSIPKIINEAPFFLIFEFKQLLISSNHCMEAKEKAQEWLKLETYAFESKEFEDLLLKITNKVTKNIYSPKNNTYTPKFKVRTIETFLPPIAFWEAREFDLVQLYKQGILYETFKSSTLTQTPDSSFMIGKTNHEILKNFVINNQQDILNGNYKLPQIFQGVPLLAASIPVLEAWNFKDVSSDVRHMFSLNTCNGCHNGEFIKNRFNHVSHRKKGSPSAISNFITGINARDPFDSTKMRYFNESQKRMTILNELANLNCSTTKSLKKLKQPASAH